MDIKNEQKKIDETLKEKKTIQASNQQIGFDLQRLVKSKEKAHQKDSSGAGNVNMLDFS